MTVTYSNTHKTHTTLVDQMYFLKVEEEYIFLLFFAITHLLQETYNWPMRLHIHIFSQEAQWLGVAVGVVNTALYT